MSPGSPTPFDPNRVLTLIPARGGSKGLPGKNIRPFAGKPLIAWTIAAARESLCSSHILVSTDDRAIAEASRQAGADVPFLRPEPLATDTATTLDVVLHALDWCAEHRQLAPDYLLLLQPTSPLRTAQDIRDALSLAAQTQSPVVSVAPAKPLPLLRTLAPDHTLHPVTNQEAARRQDLTELVALNGALYFLPVATLRETRSFLPPHTVAYLMPVARSVDIDTLEDFEFAQKLL